MAEMNGIQALLSRLALLPERIASIIEGKNAVELHSRPGQDKWSASEIFAHIRASDDIVSSRIYAVLVREYAPLVAYDERLWAEVAGYAQADFHTILALFTLRRAELVKVLRDLAPEDWQHVGIHEERGPQTLLTIVTALLEHEEEHCMQLTACFNR